MKRLPTYAECKRVVECEKGCGEATALVQFIYDNEPAGIEAEIVFRAGLLAVINELEDELEKEDAIIEHEEQDILDAHEIF